MCRWCAAERKAVGTANMLLSVANFNEALRVPQVRGAFSWLPRLVPAVQAFNSDPGWRGQGLAGAAPCWVVLGGLDCH